MSNYPEDIRRFDHDVRSPFHKGWHCPVCGEAELYTDCTESECAHDYDGWVIVTGCGVNGRDLLKYGFEIRDHGLYPDDLNAIREKLKGVYKVEDVTPEPRPGLEIGSRRWIKLTAITAATEAKRTES